VHYHIFKNAGSSVDAMLEASLGERWASFEGLHPHDVQSANALRAFLRLHPRLLAVSSHLARPPLPWCECLPIVFLRHPVLRARSVFEFMRRDPSQPFARIAKNNSFPGFVQWALGGGRGGIVVHNYQVVHLSDASFREGHILDSKATHRDLKQACDLISEWGIVGIVESFAQSVSIFQEACKAKIPGIQLRPVWHNRTAFDSLSLDIRLKGIESEIGSSLFDDLQEHNSLDLALYDFAKKFLISKGASTAGTN